MASVVPYGSLFVATREHGKGTTIKCVDDDNVEQVVSELGVRPSYNFEADVVVFVEGEEDLPIYQEWASQFQVSRRVQFIPTDGWKNMAYFANVQVLKRRNLDTAIFVVFDGDTERNEVTRSEKNKILSRLSLPSDQVCTLDEREVEGYLFNEEAIRRAFPKINLPANASEELAGLKNNEEEKQRVILGQFLKKCDVGPYTGELGAKIARHLERPKTIESLFATIKEKLKDSKL